MRITKDEFKEMFYNNTAEELGKKLGVSRITINHYAKKLGLKKGKGYYQKKVTIIDEKMWS